MTRRTLRSLGALGWPRLCALAVCVSACTARIDGPSSNGPSSNGPSPPLSAPGSTLDNSPLAPGGIERPGILQEFFDPSTDARRPLARLTKGQLSAIATDLFAVTLTASDLSSIPVSSAVDVNLDPNQYVKGVWDYASTVAKRAFTPPGALATQCASQSLSGAACARSLAESVGKLLVQRKLTSAELARFEGYYTLAEGLPEAERYEAVVKALLLAPGFLFPTEKAPTPPEESHFRLSRWTLALWNSLPNAATLDALGGPGALASGATPEALLSDPRTTRLYQRIAERYANFTELFDAVKSPALASLFPQDVRAAAGEELTLTLQHAVTTRGADSFSRLMTSSEVWVNRLNAPLYGLTTASEGFQLLQTSPQEQRSGILTNAALLSMLARTQEAGVVKRGVFVLKKLLCNPTGAPPVGVPPLEAVQVGPNATQRERLAAHASGGCQGCHSSIDGLGFGLEQYDAIGRFSPTEGATPLTGAGNYPPTMDGPGAPFSGAKELGALLGSSKQARECFLASMHTALTDRGAYPTERLALSDMRSRFVADGDVNALVLALLTDETTSARY